MGEHIRVSGFRPPFTRPDRNSRVRSVALIRPANWIGFVGAAGVIGATLLWGTPHLLLFTSSTGYGDVRWYDDCAYAGLDGRMVHLRGSSCPLFRLLKSGR